MHRAEKNNQNGFSLVEILVVLTIFLVIVIASSDFLTLGFKSTIFDYEQSEAVKNAQKANNTMVKEIRGAARGVGGQYIFDTVSTNTLIFYSDNNSDTYAEKIRYFLDGITLKQGVIQATGSPLTYSGADEEITTLAQYINNGTGSIFTYYDTDDNLIADLSADTTDIRLIHISLKINVTPSRAPSDYFVESDAQIRNLKDNL